jgi:hypothetical protein
MFSGEINDRKERKKVEKYFKTKLLVPNTNVRRWRHRSGYTYLLFGETVRAGLVRAERAAILHGDFTGKTHKILQMSYLRYETPAIFRHLIGPPKQIQIHVKKQ